MTGLLDRAFQLEILNDLADLYPQSGRFSDDKDRRLIVNVSYLDELGLVDANVSEFLDKTMKLHNAKITARGLDFLADDGGLSAILGTITVKLHDDTIRALLIQKVQDSEEPESVKAKLVDAIKSAPAETLKTLTQRAVEAGIQSLPNAVQLLQGWLATG